MAKSITTFYKEKGHPICSLLYQGNDKYELETLQESIKQITESEFYTEK